MKGACLVAALALAGCAAPTPPSSPSTPDDGQAIPVTSVGEMAWRKCAVWQASAYVPVEDAQASMPPGFRPNDKPPPLGEDLPVGLPVSTVALLAGKCDRVELGGATRENVEFVGVFISAVPPKNWTNASAPFSAIVWYLTSDDALAARLAEWGLGEAANVTLEVSASAGSQSVRASASARGITYSVEFSMGAPPAVPRGPDEPRFQRQFGSHDADVRGAADVHINDLSAETAGSARYVVENGTGVFARRPTGEAYGAGIAPPPDFLWWRVEGIPGEADA